MREINCLTEEEIVINMNSIVEDWRLEYIALHLEKCPECRKKIKNLQEASKD